MFYLMMFSLFPRLELDRWSRRLQLHLLELVDTPGMRSDQTSLI